MCTFVKCQRFALTDPYKATSENTEFRNEFNTHWIFSLPRSSLRNIVPEVVSRIANTAAFYITMNQRRSSSIMTTARVVDDSEEQPALKEVRFRVDEEEKIGVCEEEQDAPLFRTLALAPRNQTNLSMDFYLPRKCRVAFAC